MGYGLFSGRQRGKSFFCSTSRWVVAAVLMVPGRWMGLLLYRREGSGSCTLLAYLIRPPSPGTGHVQVSLQQLPICPT